MVSLRKIGLRKYIFHVSFWFGLFLIIFLALTRYDDLLFSIKFSLINTGALIIPIYIHSFIFEKYFQQKRYPIYILFTFLIILIFGYLNEFLFAFFLEGIISETYLTLALFMLVYTGLKYLKIGTKQQFELVMEEQRRIKAENELLKSQVNPHFMFNALNSIYSLIISKDEMSAEAVMKLSGLMRYMLENSKNKTVSLKQEYDFLNNYIDLERIRLNDRCKIKFEFIGNFDGKYLAPMMLIPFVENAFKHGISAQSNMNYINILMISNNREVLLNVENRIALKSNLSQMKHNKMGIDNVTQRLDLLYPGKHKLQVSETDDLYNIDLKIII